jgi:hypothetical protein
LVTKTTWNVSDSKNNLAEHEEFRKKEWENIVQCVHCSYRLTQKDSQLILTCRGGNTYGNETFLYLIDLIISLSVGKRTKSAGNQILFSLYVRVCAWFHMSAHRQKTHPPTPTVHTFTPISRPLLNRIGGKGPWSLPFEVLIQ